MSATGVDGFAVWHRSCLIVTEPFFGSATLPAAARHGAPPRLTSSFRVARCVERSRRGWHSAPRRRLRRPAPLVPPRHRALLRVGDSSCGCTSWCAACCWRCGSGCLWCSQASTVPPSSAVGALHRRRDGLDPRRRCDSCHRSESLAVWNAADVASILPRVDGFAVWHRSCLIVAELSFFGSATLSAAALMVRRLLLAMRQLMPLA